MAFLRTLFPLLPAVSCIAATWDLENEKIDEVCSLPLLNNYDIWGDGSGYNQFGFSNDSEYALDQMRDPRVLNFFPIPVEEECTSNDGRRKGVCMNTYECRIQGGSSHGFCALGFGVCCVFTATCDQDVYNNITYFVNPHFPDLSLGMSTCNLKLRKIDSEISQIRLDFIHFNLGQPNRRTGICEEDVFTMSGGSSRDLTICGVNSGQHVYYDVENIEDAINISINLTRRAVARLWEVRVIQVPFAQRAPVGCLQYHTGNKGIVQTMNFAENGRHLANQDYNICMRQEEGMCSIIYEPCDENSFKIGPNTGSMGTPQQVEGLVQINETTQALGDQVSAADTMNEMIEGSGDASLDAVASESRNMEICVDKIVMPCNSEDLIVPGDSAQGYCNIAHCGDSFCPYGEGPCKIETSVTPFTIGVHFGPSAREAIADDNLGMCLTFQQLPCNEG